MSKHSYFEIEESDIVKLVGGNDGASGWVNVGVHAVLIQLDDEGNLRVEAFSRTSEGSANAMTILVAKATAIRYGGEDPDIGFDEKDDA